MLKSLTSKTRVVPDWFQKKGQGLKTTRRAISVSKRETGHRIVVIDTREFNTTSFNANDLRALGFIAESRGNDESALLPAI
jgi:hypothetical protein